MRSLPGLAIDGVEHAWVQQDHDIVHDAQRISNEVEVIVELL